MKSATMSYFDQSNKQGQSKQLINLKEPIQINQ